MPDLGPMGKGGARRRTRRRMMAINEMQNSRDEPQEEVVTESSDKLQKLAKLLKDKGVITESEYDSII